MDNKKKTSRKTHWIYLLTRILDTPLWAIYNMLPIILCKSLGATPFQVAAIVALKPAVSLFSTYWSARINARPDRLVSNIIVARLIGCLPFLLFFAKPNVWVIIAAAGLYMAMAVGVVPAWMELLKRNIDESSRKKTFAYGSSLGYLGGGVLPIAIAIVLDHSPEAWSWLFGFAALIALSTLAIQRYLKVEGDIEPQQEANNQLSLLAPWRSAYSLLSSNPNFLRYQIAFMVMSGGLMIIGEKSNWSIKPLFPLPANACDHIYSFRYQLMVLQSPLKRNI